MKKLSIFVLVCSFSTVLTAQEEINSAIIPKSELQGTKAVSKSRTTDSKVTDSHQSTTISVRPGEAQVTHGAQFYQSEIDKIDRHIEMIDEKIAFVMNSPEDNQQAIDTGWFDQMETIKSELAAKKVALQAKLN